VNVGAIQNGSFSHEHYSPSPSKTLRAAMGCSVRLAGFPGRAKDRPIEKLTGQHCSARGKSQRKTHRVETADHIIRSVGRDTINLRHVVVTD
jgi:hypothetical protein